MAPVRAREDACGLPPELPPNCLRREDTRRDRQGRVPLEYQTKLDVGGYGQTLRDGLSGFLNRRSQV